MKTILKWLGGLGALALGIWTLLRWYSEHEIEHIEDVVVRG